SQGSELHFHLFQFALESGAYNLRSHRGIKTRLAESIRLAHRQPRRLYRAILAGNHTGGIRCGGPQAVKNVRTYKSKC
ncbi:hypothetical protein LCGC14_2824750, partial [marine sediment metagenome]